VFSVGVLVWTGETDSLLADLASFQELSLKYVPQRGSGSFELR
jgi:hypothetical protein